MILGAELSRPARARSLGLQGRGWEGRGGEEGREGVLKEVQRICFQWCGVERGVEASQKAYFFFLRSRLFFLIWKKDSNTKVVYCCN